MSSRIPTDEHSPFFWCLLQAQQAPALPYAKVVGSTGSYPAPFSRTISLWIHDFTINRHCLNRNLQRTAFTTLFFDLTSICKGSKKKKKITSLCIDFIMIFSMVLLKLVFFYSSFNVLSLTVFIAFFFSQFYDQQTIFSFSFFHYHFFPTVYPCSSF